MSDPVVVAGAWHTLGNVKAIEGDLLTAAQLHGMGKEVEGKTLPPLAVRYQKEEWCNEIGDIFWVSSFAKYNIFQVRGERVRSEGQEKRSDDRILL